MKRGRVGFLKPREDDDQVSGYQEDRPDLDTNSQTSFVYNPYQVNQPQYTVAQTVQLQLDLGLIFSIFLQNQDIDRQRARLPIAAYRDNLLYLLENHQVRKGVDCDAGL